ncbi:hypothetical protein GCM10007148_27380 [Parvularcula lutaonensis]|nr:hypothetical protein GCM10007148_27380 [Parvularcula lutaonensis]
MQLQARALHLDVLDLHIDPLDLHIDPLDLHIDPLDLHIDPLVLNSLLAFERLSDPSQADNLHLILEPLQQLGAIADQLDVLHARLSALDVETLDLHIDPLAEGQVQSILGALEGIQGLSAQLRQIGEIAIAVTNAYDQYQALYARAEASYGALIEGETGKGFEDGFLTGFLAKHGLSGDGFIDFLQMSEGERAQFLIDLNDQLFTFAGVDHPDHWMGAVNWSPRLSEVAGFGEGVTIGVVDQAFAGNGALGDAPETLGAIVEGQDHGLAVTGVLAGALDGEGVMGVAPEASIVLANPFDRQSEADEKSVMRAIRRVGQSGASIINLSLGEEGAAFSEGWAEVFQNAGVQSATDSALFVMAAGNTGVEQDYDVDMAGTNGAIERLILVGSIDPSGDIASFSNTPGDACFTTADGCTPMMERFLVAPGQQILVSTPDGVGRASGTSFATPMVSGAAALLQSRWAWLADNPEATAEILFRSADDLGAPGVDEVFGWGLLNISASQRPLDAGALFFRTGGGDRSITNAGFTPNLMARVNRGATVTVFETVGDTFRDFKIPVGVLEAGVIDPRVTLQNDAEAYFGDRVGASSGQNQAVAGLSFSGSGRFSDVAPKGTVAFGGQDAGWVLSLEAREPSHGLVVPEGDLAFETHATLEATETGMTFRFGHGDGALGFSGSAFGLTSDHDIRTGGVNPMLGLASGGAYFQAQLPVTERLTLSGGVSSRDRADLVLNPFSGEISERVAGTEGYSAAAANAAIVYSMSDRLTLNVGVTALRETDGFLGGQSVGALSFGEQALSRSVTVGFDSDLGAGFNVAVSATAGRTTGRGSDDGLLAVGDEGVVSTAYQAALGKTGVFGDDDRLRISFAQPLHIEEGSLAVQSLGVIDRQTGTLGLMPDTIGLGSADRRYVGEVLYGRPVFDGRAQLSFFGQVDTSPFLSPGEAATTGGLRFSIGF